uniref:Uncharacterized protein n=1 Tax=Aegilops tauschii subsp. strangulata TaxID=200361 RepID=A0A452YJA8_AEGTS
MCKSGVDKQDIWTRRKRSARLVRSRPILNSLDVKRLNLVKLSKLHQSYHSQRCLLYSKPFMLLDLVGFI